MSRDINHPHVRTIIRALDCAERNDSIVSVGSLLVTLGEDVEHFVRRGKPRWTHEAIRTVVLTYALSAPDEELRYMASVARAEMKELARIARIERDEAQEAAVQ